MIKDKLAILTVIYQNIYNLDLLFYSLYKQTYKNFKVFIVNNFPLNNAHNYLTELNKKYKLNYELLEQKENTGYARGNNIGTRYAINQGYELIFIINDDVFLDNKCIENLIKFNNSFNKMVITAPLVLRGLPASQNRIQTFGYRVDFKKQLKKSLYDGQIFTDNLLPNSLKVDYVLGAAFLIRSEIAKVHEIFDEDYFMYNDEIDLGYRMKIANIEYYVTKKAKAWHNHDWARTNISGYNFMYFYMMRNRYLYFKKHNLHLYMLFDLIKQLVTFPLTVKMFIKIGSIKIIKYYYKGIVKGLAGEKGISSTIFH